MNNDRDSFISRLSDCAGKHLTVGNDIVFLPSFSKVCTPDFIERVFTTEELSYCNRFANPALRFASTWAAKEAVYKSIKQMDDEADLWWKDIEIIRDRPQGKPTVIIKEKATNFDFSLSISHDQDYVWAIALCFRKEQKVSP